MERKIYPSLDIVKFVMALSILGGHTANEWAHSTGLLHLALGASNFAVPFFFACSGFLFFSKLSTLNSEEANSYYKKWSIRVGKMYLVWSLIYFCFYFFGDWMVLGFPQEKILNWLHRSLVFSTYATIWFLPALWGGVTICFLLRRYCSKYLFWCIMAILLVIGNTFGAYSNIVTSEVPCLNSLYDWYMEVFITWRNAVFNGAPFVAVGALALERSHKVRISSSILLLLTVVFCVLYLVEGYLIVTFKFGPATDQGFMMLPAIYFMMLFLLQWEVKQIPLWTHLRNLSMLIFLDQRLFLSAIPNDVLSKETTDAILNMPEWSIYLLFMSVVIIFSIIVERLSYKYKFLKILW